MTIECECGFSATAETQAGCCSETWWSDIDGVSEIVGRQVDAIRDIDLSGYDVNDGRGRQEEDQAYGFALCSGEIHATFVFRNSSNGYYGGWIQTASKPSLGLDLVTNSWRNNGGIAMNQGDPT